MTLETILWILIHIIWILNEYKRITLYGYKCSDYKLNMHIRVPTYLEYILVHLKKL